MERSKAATATATTLSRQKAKQYQEAGQSSAVLLQPFHRLFVEVNRRRKSSRKLNIMDIEFHYYMTYLIAARAGYSPEDATIIAHAAQSVDDNHIPVRLTDKTGEVYENDLSQTMDILRPHMDAKIYPIFHFIPGDPKSPTARRVDGAEHPLVTTPDSFLANAMIDTALRSKDLYRIGVSAHGYVDTWAHQNFVGQRDVYNQFETGFFARIKNEFLAVGHAHAKHNPDWPALVWEDSRLIESRVDNRVRFMIAAGRLFEKFVAQTKPSMAPQAIKLEVAALKADLDADIGEQDDENANVEARIQRYIARGATSLYGGVPIPRYVVGTWFAEAIAEDRNDVAEKTMSRSRIPYLTDVMDALEDVFADGYRQNVTWRSPDPTVYKTSNWFRFQQAVTKHLNECWAMLQARREAA